MEVQDAPRGHSRHIQEGGGCLVDVCLMKAHVCSVTNPMAFPRKLKLAPATLPTIAGNASTAFPASLLNASAKLSNHFFRHLRLLVENLQYLRLLLLLKHLQKQGKLLK